jgi:hypothetical protein
MDPLLLVTPRLLDASKPSVGPVRIAITDETTPDELKEQISEEFGLGSFPVKLHSLSQFEGDKEEWVAVSAAGLLRMMQAYASTGELRSHLKLGPRLRCTLCSQDSKSSSSSASRVVVLAAQLHLQAQAPLHLQMHQLQLSSKSSRVKGRVSSQCSCGWRILRLLWPC